MGSALDSTWAHMPLVSRIVITGVLLSVISLSTPMWVYIRDGSGNPDSDLTFGLFHYCNGPVCTSIHDNLVPGKDVPFWFHMTQVCFFIGCVCCAMVMFIMVSVKKGKKLHMTTSMNQMVTLLMLAGVTQMFTALYTFVMYFEDTNFLYEDVQEVDFYGSFYCGLAGAIANFFGGMMLFFDEEITKPLPDKKKTPENLLFRDFRFKRPEFIPVGKAETKPYPRRPGELGRPYKNLMEELYYTTVRKQRLHEEAMKNKNTKKKNN